MPKTNYKKMMADILKPKKTLEEKKEERRKAFVVAPVEPKKVNTI